ncbi:MAG TPA: universal stress protein, partial [Candidatus Thermoplasmatota archaeon]|nr:universal stress protein [Candidatus Thermoplasmatota archaeon]
PREMLVGVDGSAPSDAALILALAWAKRAGARLHAVHATPDFPAPWNHGPTGRLDLQKIAEAEGRKVLDKTVDEARRSGVAVTPHLKHGDPARNVLAAAKETGADLVVVGSHGYGPVNRWLLGSVSTSIVSHAPLSVLVVRGTPPEAPRRILLGVDGSERAVTAAAWALALADRFGATLTVCHIAELPTSPIFGPSDLEALTGWLNKARAQFPAIQAGGKAVAVEMTSGSPGTRLNEVAETGGYDLIVVGASGSHGPASLFLGNTSRKVVQGAPCSVLIAH